MTLKAKDDKFFVSDILNEELRKLEKIYASKRGKGFELAFCIRDSFLRWKMQYPTTDFKYFLREYLKQGRIQAKRTTLILAYNVAVAFKDLEDIQRKKSFECYRIIANAGLSQDTMDAIRARLEEDEKYNSAHAERWVKQAQRDERKKAKEDGIKDVDEAEITYVDMSQFGKKFRKLFNPSENTRFYIMRMNKEGRPLANINSPVVHPESSDQSQR